MATTLITATSSMPTETSIPGDASPPIATPTVLNEAKEKHSNFLATIVALGILGFYAILIVITLLIWCIRRCTRPAQPDPTYLPPEATMRGNGAFLVPTPQAPVAPAGGKVRRKKRRSRAGTVASVVTQSDARSTRSTRSTRSMFYEGPGYARSQHNSFVPPHHEGQHSTSHLIPLPSPRQSPVYTPEGSLYGGQDDMSSVRSGRSRAASAASSRYHQPEYHAQTTPPVPTMPHMALTPERYRGGWV